VDLDDNHEKQYMTSKFKAGQWGWQVFRIDNPLNHLHPEDLRRLARETAGDYGADEDLFETAAQIANDPLNWDKFGVKGQTAQAFKDEKNQGFWKQPKALRVSIVTLCFSAMVQGWIQSVSVSYP
jgi:hypothetical protein